MKLDGSAARDVHERERCEDVNENRCSFFFYLSRCMTKLKHPCLASLIFFLRDEFVVAAREEPYILSVIPARLDVVVCRTVLRAVFFTKHRVSTCGESSPRSFKYHPQCVFVFFFSMYRHFPN